MTTLEEIEEPKSYVVNFTIDMVGSEFIAFKKLIQQAKDYVKCKYSSDISGNNEIELYIFIYTGIDLKITKINEMLIMEFKNQEDLVEYRLKYI